MSTKISLYYTDEIHLYRESLDDDSVYLRVSKDGFEVTLELAASDFGKAAGTFDLGSLERQSRVTDEEIASYCRRQVDQRISSDGLVKFCGVGIFGLSDSPRETQIEQGVQFFRSRRDRLVSMLSEIRSSRSSKMQFGLEPMVDEP